MTSQSILLKILRVIGLLAWLAHAWPIAPIQAEADDDYVPNEVVIKLSSASVLAAVAADYHLDPAPLSQFGTRPIFRMQITDGAEPPDRAAALQLDSRVLYAEPNYVSETPESRQRVSWPKGGEEGDYVEQWADEVLRLSEAHTINRGAGVVVAVLDTGVDRHHPALAGRLLAGYDFVDMDSDPSETGVYGQNLAYGHGTHVAGLVALVAPEAQILPIRVLDADGMGNIWVLAEALRYAVDPDNNPATDDGADVINLSLSTTRPTQLLTEIVHLVTCDNDDSDDGDDHGDDDDCLTPARRGVVVVAAAGNNASSTPEYPAAEGVPSALAVAASSPADVLANFSNYGGWVHVAAPGEAITSAVPGGGYATWSGTSMAAPFVAGQAALVRAVYPYLPAAAVTEIILETADAISGEVPMRVDVASAVGYP